MVVGSNPTLGATYKKKEFMFKLFETGNDGHIAINMDNVVDVCNYNNSSIRLNLVNGTSYIVDFNEEVSVEEFLEALDDDDLIAFPTDDCTIRKFTAQAITRD
jgi:hypothetical protein